MNGSSLITGPSFIIDKGKQNQIHYLSFSPSDQLVQAIWAKNLINVQNALQKGADPNGAYGFKNVIHLACEIGYLSVVLALIHAGANIDQPEGKEYNTPLHLASFIGHDHIVKELLKNKANYTSRNRPSYMTPLEAAITYGNFKCCKLLVEAQAEINEINFHYFCTPLTDACYRGHYNIVELLLNANANPNLFAHYTSLNRAVAFPLIMLLLLHKGAHVNQRNSLLWPEGAGETALHQAAKEGYNFTVYLLLAYKSDKSIKNKQGYTALQLAEFQLYNHMTNPCNPPPITASIISNLKLVINLLK